MIRKATLLLAAPLLALGFATGVQAHSYTASCAVGNFGTPPVNGFEVTGSGYTVGHTYYGRVAQPDGAGTAQVLYESYKGEFFFLDYNIVTPQHLPSGRYTISIYQSVHAYRSGRAQIAGCSAVAP